MVKVFKNQAEADTIYQDIVQKYRVDTTFQFKQKVMNYLMCTGKNNLIPFCTLFSKDMQMATDSIMSEIFLDKIEILIDEPDRTILKETTSHGKIIYISISKSPLYNEPCFLEFREDETLHGVLTSSYGHSSYYSFAPFCSNLLRDEIYE